jgi:hypothetical protein
MLCALGLPRLFRNPPKEVLMARIHQWILLPALVAALPMAAAAEESCVRRVFGEYCLGGQISDQMRKDPQFVHQQREGEHFAVIYVKGQETIYVMAFKERIYKVLRRYDSPTVLRFLDLKRLLTDKYGVPEDLSRYPGYARNRASKMGAIRRGEGYAELVWTPEGVDWKVTLGWTRELGLTLDYRIKELDEAQRAAGTAGL